MDNPQRRRIGQYIGAGAIIGIGLGMLMNNIPAWTIVGIGVGLVLGLFRRDR